MVPVSAFFTRLQPHITGCSEPLMQQALVDAAIQFCDKSLVVTANLDPVSSQSGVSYYELDMPSQQQLAQVMRVWYDGRLLGPAPSYQIEVDPEYQPSGHPTYYFTRDEDEQLGLQLFPTPDESKLNAIKMRVATKPTRNATQLHSALFNDWSDALVMGALARLFEMPDQNFTNEPKSIVANQRFTHMTSVARIEGLRGRVVSSMTVKQRPFI